MWNASCFSWFSVADRSPQYFHSGSSLGGFSRPLQECRRFHGSGRYRLLCGSHFVGSKVLQNLYFADTVIASASSSTKFSHPTLLAWLCTIGLLFASLPSSTSVLHAVYVVLILQVWSKLPTSWRAAEN
jgi:hypothetical protein